MRTRLNSLFIAFLNVAASTQKLGINLIRVAILVIFVWIGGLKFWNYEAEGIVPFVANSPFMSFFYTKSAPEYKEYKLKEGEFNEAKQMARGKQHVWLFTRVGNLNYGYRHTDIFRDILFQNRTGRCRIGYHHDIRDTFVSGHHTGSLGTGLG
jgi:hypothetical protein